MKHSIFITIIILLLFSCSKKTQDPTFLVKGFFLTYEEKGIYKALDKIFQSNDWLFKQSTNDIENLKKDLNTHINLLGDYHGYEIVSERFTGECLINYSCIVKYDRQPLRFSFMFYKASSTWVLYDFKYDNNLIDELNEAAKFYYLK